MNVVNALWRQRLSPNSVAEMGPLPSQGRSPNLRRSDEAFVFWAFRHTFEGRYPCERSECFVSSANFNTSLLRWTPAFTGVTPERRVSDTVCSSVASYLRRQG